MDGRKQIIFDHKIGDNEYIFAVPDGAPLAECYLAIGIFFDEMVRRININAANMKPKEVEGESPEAEEIKEEECDGCEEIPISGETE